MSYNASEILFCRHDMFSLMDAHRQQASQLVQQINGNVLLNTPTEDIVADITARCEFDIPVLHRDQAHADQREAQVQIHDYFSRGYDGVRSAPGTLVELHVPFTGDRDFFFVRPTTFDSAPPSATVGGDQITVRVSGQNLTQQAVKQQLEGTLDAIDKYLGWQKSSATELNNSLPNVIRTAVEGRKSKLLADQNLVAGLGYNLKPRSDAPKTYVAPSVRRKVQIPKRRSPQRHSNPNQFLMKQTTKPSSTLSNRWRR